LTVLVSQLPIGLGQSLEPDPGSTGLHKRKTGHGKRHNRDQKQDRQRMATLPNGLQQCQPPATILDVLNNIRDPQYSRSALSR
jgi:hypothetical protein